MDQYGENVFNIIIIKLASVTRTIMVLYFNRVKASVVFKTTTLQRTYKTNQKREGYFIPNIGVLIAFCKRLIGVSPKEIPHLKNNT